MTAQLNTLVSDVTKLVSRWNTREDQMIDWLNGTVDGGPNGDGQYPLTDALGETHLITCPAKLADTVEGPAGQAESARDAAQTARDAAQSSEASAQDSLATTQTIQADLETLQSNVAGLRNETENSANKAMNYRDASREARDAAQSSQNEAAASADSAANSEQAALTSQQDASASAKAASQSESVVANSASEAANSAASATASATDADASEAAAANSASSAADSATASKNAATSASTSEANAANSASASASSASDAAGSADSASTSATQAGDSAAAAGSAETAAKASESAAAKSESAAGVSAGNAVDAEAGSQKARDAAQVSQSAAATSASGASTSESNAADSASASANSADAASTSASQASTSADAASASASDASDSATIAGNEADDASGSATAANASANRADTQADSASTSATNAAGSADAANSSATAASDSASSASNSASAAATSETNAGDSAASASSSASAAKSSATGASGSASDASDSASAAATSESNASNSASASASSAADAQAAQNNAESARDETRDALSQATLKNNDTATRDPGPDDDETQGFSVRSAWINTQTGEMFRAVNVTAGQAKWPKATFTADELGSAAMSQATDFVRIGEGGNVKGPLRQGGFDVLTEADRDDFATAAQGSRADSAVQPDNVSDVLRDGDRGDFATAAQGDRADSAVQPGDVSDALRDSDRSDFASAAQGSKADSAVQPSEVSDVLRDGDRGDFASSAQGSRADSAMQPGDKAADSDKLDNLNSDQFLRSDTDQNFSGRIIRFTQNNAGVRFENSGGNDHGGIQWNNADGTNQGELEFWTDDDWQEPFVFRQYDQGVRAGGSRDILRLGSVEFVYRGHRVYHEGHKPTTSEIGAATSAQGDRADSAVQPSDVSDVLRDGDRGDFASSAQGSRADSALQPGDTLGNVIFDSGTNTLVRVRADNNGEAVIRASGTGQGTGRLEVCQNDGAHGGGIEYNGDNSPSSTAAGGDYVTLYRISSGSYAWTARNKYSSNVWEFRDTPEVTGGGHVWHEGNLSPDSFATSVQGGKADSALQPGEAASETGVNSGDVTGGRLTFGGSASFTNDAGNYKNVDNLIDSVSKNTAGPTLIEGLWAGSLVFGTQGNSEPEGFYFVSKPNGDEPDDYTSVTAELTEDRFKYKGQNVYHEGHKPTLGELGAAPAGGDPNTYWQVRTGTGGNDAVNIDYLNDRLANNPGPEGPQGPQGPKGDTGARGPAGADGQDGARGPRGYTGDTGATGPQGPQGDTGGRGPSGADGQDGARGPRGYRGAQGPVGESVIKCGPVSSAWLGSGRGWWAPHNTDPGKIVNVWAVFEVTSNTNYFDPSNGDRILITGFDMNGTTITLSWDNTDIRMTAADPTFLTAGRGDGGYRNTNLETDGTVHLYMQVTN